MVNDDFPFPKEFDAMIANDDIPIPEKAYDKLFFLKYKESNYLYSKICEYFFFYKNSPLNGWLIHQDDLVKLFPIKTKNIFKSLNELQEKELIIFKSFKGNYYLIFIIYEQIQTFIDSLKNDEYEISLTPKIVLKATEKRNIVQFKRD